MVPQLADVPTVCPKKYAHGFVVLCFVVVMQSFIMNSHEVFIHIHQGCFAGTGAIVRFPQCQWSKPDGYGKISPWWIWENQSMYNHNKAQQSKNRVHISWDILYYMHNKPCCILGHPDSKVHGANMGSIWGRQDPGGPHVGHRNLAIWASIKSLTDINIELK